jgi:hypothetical protein
MKQVIKFTLRDYPVRLRSTELDSLIIACSRVILNSCRAGQVTACRLTAAVGTRSMTTKNEIGADKRNATYYHYGNDLLSIYMAQLA